MQWRKIVRCTIAVAAILIVMMVAGGYLYLCSSAFREFARRNIIAQANEATGGQTEIGSIGFDFSRLTADLHHVVFHGSEPPNAPPLLSIEKLTVGLTVQSLLHRKITLSELLIERPVLHVEVNRDGLSNLPARRNPSSNHTSIFDLAIGRVLLTHGEVNYQDRKIPLDADVSNFLVDIAFESASSRYRGSIAYDNGSLRYGEYVPLAHSVDAKFEATPSRFSLQAGLLKVASSSVRLHGELSNYGDPSIDGDYDVELHAQDVSDMAAALKPAGTVWLNGSFHYRNNPKRPWLRNLALNGTLGSQSLSALASDRRIEVRKLGGSYQLKDAALEGRGIDGEMLGGGIVTDFDLEHLDTSPVVRIQAGLRNISLAAIQRQLNDPQLKRVQMSGNVDGTTTLAWNDTISNLRVGADLAVRSGNHSSTYSSSQFPVDGVIHATWERPKNIFAVRQTSLQIASATLHADGQVSRRSDLRLIMIANDLTQLGAMVAAIDPNAKRLPPIAGSATLNANLHGSLQEPNITAQVSARDLQVQDSHWKTVGLSLRADPSKITISDGVLENASRGRATFDASAVLRKWAYRSSDAIHADVSVQQMSLADLQRLANVSYPVTGSLSGKVSVNGSQLAPTGSGALTVTKARAYDQPVQTVSLAFHTQNATIISSLDVEANAGTARANLSYAPKTEAYEVRLDAPQVVLQKLQAVRAKNLPLNGTLSFSANGQGTLTDPQLTAALQVPRLELRQQSITGLNAQIRIAHKQADVSLDSQVAQAKVRARGHVDLSGDYQAAGSLDTDTFSLGPLMAAYATVPDGFQGRTELHATLHGPLKDKSRLDAHLVIARLDLAYQAVQIGAAGPIRADYSGSIFSIQPAEIRGTGTDLHIQGSVPLAGKSAPTLSAQGSIDAQIIRVFSPDIHSSGMVTVDVKTTGVGPSPQVRGQVHLQNIAVTSEASPLGIDKLNGIFDLDQHGIQTSDLTAEVGGGQVSVRGNLAYSPGLKFDFAVEGKSIRFRYPDGVRSNLDSNITWAGTTSSSAITGRVLVSGLSFTPDFDLSKLGDQLGGDQAQPQPGFTDTINLQVAVQSKGNLSATSSQVSLEGNANLLITGTASNPVITGRTDLTSGEMFYRNVRYQLQRGIVTFDDPNETRPALNVSATTSVEQYNLRLNLRGSLDALTVSYSSDPPLATADIINLLARGQTTSESAASNQSTDSILASQAAGQVSGSLQQLAGISSLQIDPLFGANNQDPSARVGIQQRVTKNFLFTFSTDVSQPGSEIVQGEYQIDKRWSVSVARDQLGGVAVDGRFHTKF